MKDFVGNPLTAGDFVAVCMQDSSRPFLELAQVVSGGDKMISVEFNSNPSIKRLILAAHLIKVETTTAIAHILSK